MSHLESFREPVARASRGAFGDGALVLFLRALLVARHVRQVDSAATSETAFDRVLDEGSPLWRELEEGPRRAAAQFRGDYRFAEGAVRETFRLAFEALVAGACTRDGLLEFLQNWVWQRPSVGAMAKWLSELLVELADRSLQGKVVYCPWDYSGILSLSIALRGGKPRLAGVVGSEIPELLWALAELDSSCLTLADPIRVGAETNEDGSARLFDVSLAAPPIGVRYDRDALGGSDDRFPDKTQNGSILAIRQMLWQTKGAVVVVVPDVILFGSGAEEDFRRELLRAGQVRAVIALPVDRSQGWNVPTSILLLDQGGGNRSVRFIDANAYGPVEVGRRRARRTSEAPFDIARLLSDVRPEFADGVTIRDVSVETLLGKADHGLQVKQYLGSQVAEKRVAAFRSGRRCRPLRDIVDVILPRLAINFRAREGGIQGESYAEYREVTFQDIPERGAILESQRTIELPEKLTLKQRQELLQDGDLLLAKQSKIGLVGMFRSGHPDRMGQWVAGSSFVILRGRDADQDHMTAVFLLLRSDIGQEMLREITSHSTTSQMSSKDLESLQVPELTEDEIRQAVKVFGEECRMQEEIARLRSEVSKLADDLWVERDACHGGL